MPLVVVAIPQWWGWSPYFENYDGEKIEKYSHEIDGKKIQFEKQKKSRHYDENMGLYKLAEWFEQNIKNMNELNH